MPRLSDSVIKARAEAFDIAISALEQAYEAPDITLDQHNGYRVVLKKLKRERDAFVDKYAISNRTCGKCTKLFLGFEDQENDTCPDCHADMYFPIKTG